MTNAVVLPRDSLFRAVPGIKMVERAADDGPERVLAGHFAVFNRWTEIDSWFEGNFMERIAQGAFKKTFRENIAGMRCLFQHGRDPQIGDKPLGSIDALTEDETGAAYEVGMFDTSYNRDLIPGLAAGVYGASFRFRVIREDLNMEPGVSADNPKGIPERTIREAAVSEFGPVTFPAYAEATAGLRSITDDVLARMMAQRDPDLLARLAAELTPARPGRLEAAPDDSAAPAEDAGPLATSDARREQPDIRPLSVVRNPNRQRRSA